MIDEIRKEAFRDMKKRYLAIAAAEMQESRIELDVITIMKALAILIRTLKEKGIPVRDWDNPDRIVERIQYRRGKLYFLIREDTASKGGHHGSKK